MEHQLLTELKQWIEATAEIFIEIHYPHTGGVCDYLFVHSFLELETLLSLLPAAAGLIAYRQQALPLRGEAAEILLLRTKEAIPDGTDWFLIRRKGGDPTAFQPETQLTFVRAREHIFGGVVPYYAEGGSSHSDLISIFLTFRGWKLAIGPDLFDAWRDTGNVISATVKDLVH
jgi:hypothetical protein